MNHRLVAFKCPGCGDKSKRDPNFYLPCCDKHVERIKKNKKFVD